MIGAAFGQAAFGEQPALVAPATLTLGTSAAQSSATLAVTAKTTVPLDTSAAQSAATLALSAQTTVPLDTSAATSTATLALTAKTQVALDTSAAQANATLALTAPTGVPLGTSSAQSDATLALSATTQVPLGTSAAQATPTLALTAKTQVVLGSAAATASPTLALTRAARLVSGQNNLRRPNPSTSGQGWQGFFAADLTGVAASDADFGGRGITVTCPGGFGSGVGANFYPAYAKLGATANPVVAGDWAAARARIKITSQFAHAPNPIYVGIRWYNSAGSTVSDSFPATAGSFTSALQTLLVGEIWDLTCVAQAPATALFGTPILLSQTFGDTTGALTVGQFLGTKVAGSGSTVPDYGDGSKVGWYWAGTAFDSESNHALVADGTTATTLALTAPAQVVLGAATVVATGTLALAAPTTVPLDAVTAQASATLALSAPTEVALGAAAASSSASLELTAPAEVLLETSAATSTASLDLTASTTPTIGLTSDGVSTATLELSVPAEVVLGSSDATSTGTLDVTTNPPIYLASDATATATMVIGVPIPIELTGAAVSDGTLELSATTGLALGTSVATSNATGEVIVPRVVVLGASAGVSNATLDLPQPVFRQYTTNRPTTLNLAPRTRELTLD